MNKRVQQLQYSVQMLALPVTAQLRLYGGEKCKVSELAQALVYWQEAAHGELNAEQTAVLDRLNRELTELCCSEKKRRWSELDLRKSCAWQHVRQTAREVLLLFDWPLDLPPTTFFV